MNQGKILFTEQTHSILAKKLTNAGFHCVYLPQLTKYELIETAYQYFGIITRSKFTIDKDIIDAVSSDFKFIGRVGAGMDNINVKYAAEKGIICFNSPEGNRDAVGEHAIGMLLALLNNINRANSEVKNGIWLREKNRGIEIKSKTIGIIGYGNMGSSFAEKLSGFGTNVIAYDKYKNNYKSKFLNLDTNNNKRNRIHD
jgi:D-3-phosphoglycerate dehydrogenase